MFYLYTVQPSHYGSPLGLDNMAKNRVTFLLFSIMTELDCYPKFVSAASLKNILNEHKGHQVL